MRLKQLIFQGVLDQASPGRLQFAGGVDRVSLPDGISMGDARALLIQLLFPTAGTDTERQILQQSSNPKLALVVESGPEVYRIVRGASPDSIRVQGRRADDWHSVAEGASNATKFLEQQLGRPSIRIFRALNLWDFEGAARESAPVVDPEKIGPEAVEMVEEYRQTLELDEVEAELAEYEEKIQRLRDKYGEGLDVERRLEQARRQLERIDLSTVDEQDLETLEQKDERLSEYRDKLEQLERDEKQAREKVAHMEPEPPWRRQALWVGLGVGLLAVIASLASSSLRFVVLADAVGFGMVAWTLLRYLTDREQVNIHRVRVESVKRRSTEVRREMVEFQEKVDHILVHADAESEKELIDRYQKAKQLRQVVDDLEAKAEKLADNDKYQKARERLEELEKDYEELQARREELPDYGADLFRLENELQTLGVDPAAVERAHRGGGEADQEDDGETPPFVLLVELAEELGYWSGGALEEKPAKLWRKMTRHILGDEFKEVSVDPEEGLVVEGFDEGEELATWLVRHPDEARLLAGTLALALHLRSVNRGRRVETVWLEDPEDRYPAALAEGFDDVIKGAAKRAHFALVKSA